MSVQADSHVATVGGASLDVAEGSVSFDSTRAPFVQQRLTIPLPARATLENLDPRKSPVPRVLLRSSKAGIVRDFDLHVRGTRIDRERAVVELSLASDEALLSDWASPTDDDAPYQYQTSLRAICNYVLGKVIPGAALAPTPANDANATIYSAASNLIPDPRVTALTDYGAVGATRAYDTTYPGPQTGVGHNGLHLHTPTSTDSFVSIGGDAGALRLGMKPGARYTFSATGSVRTTLSGTAHARALRLVAFYRSGSGAIQEVRSAPISAAVNATTRVAVTFDLPKDATEAWIRAYHGRGAGSLTWALWRLSEETEPGTHNTDYFWGGKPGTSAYAFSWSGTPDASASERRLVIDAPSPDSLWWRAGISALDFLAPIVQTHGYRLVCDERRVWTLRGESYLGPGTVNLREGVNVVNASDQIDRSDGLWFDACVVKYRWLDRAGVQRERIDSHIREGYSRLITIELDAPYPGPGFAAYAVRRAQGRGREITATAPADWSVTAEQSLAARLNDSPAQLGTVLSVEFDIGADRMSITARTVETLPGAINLIDGTVNSLPGTVNNL